MKIWSNVLALLYFISMVPFFISPQGVHITLAGSVYSLLVGFVGYVHLAIARSKYFSKLSIAFQIVSVLIILGFVASIYIIFITPAWCGDESPSALFCGVIPLVITTPLVCANVCIGTALLVRIHRLRALENVLK